MGVAAVAAAAPEVVAAVAAVADTGNVPVPAGAAVSSLQLHSEIGNQIFIL